VVGGGGGDNVLSEENSFTKKIIHVTGPYRVSDSHNTGNFQHCGYITAIPRAQYDLGPRKRW
jgi:hypothetical protein